MEMFIKEKATTGKKEKTIIGQTWIKVKTDPLMTETNRILIGSIIPGNVEIKEHKLIISREQRNREVLTEAVEEEDRLKFF